MAPQNKLVWFPPAYLPAQLTGNRPSRTRHQDALAAHTVAYALAIDLRRLATQKISDINFTQAVDADFSADQFVDTGHRAEWAPGAAAGFGHLAQHTARRAGNGHHDFIGMLGGGHP